MDQFQFITEEVWEAIAPILFTAITALVGLALNSLRQWLPPVFRGFYEKKLQDDLEKALLNGAQAALQGNWKHFDFDKEDQSALIQYVMDTAKQGAGEAISNLSGGVSDGKLAQLAQSKIFEVAERKLQMDLNRDGRIG